MTSITGYRLLSGFGYESCLILRRLFRSQVGLQIFDRSAKKKQRDWAAKQDDFDLCQYVKNEIGYRVADKIYDLTQFNPICLDIGCNAGHIAPHVLKENIGCLVEADMSAEMVIRAKESPEVLTVKVICDEELAPFRADSFDLIVTSLSAHWINDLPGYFRHLYRILRPGSALIGALFADDSLFELRCSLQLAEIERLGGVGVHISPFTQAQDIGSLLQRAGFELITLDSDQLVVGYPDLFTLLHDLQGMAESAAVFQRSGHMGRRVLIAADAIYKQMYGQDNGIYPATFQILSFIGWRSGPNMPKPAERGSQTISLKEISSFIEDLPPS